MLSTVEVLPRDLVNIRGHQNFKILISQCTWNCCFCPFRMRRKRVFLRKMPHLILRTLIQLYYIFQVWHFLDHNKIKKGNPKPNWVRCFCPLPLFKCSSIKYTTERSEKGCGINPHVMYKCLELYYSTFYTKKVRQFQSKRSIL